MNFALGPIEIVIIVLFVIVIVLSFCLANLYSKLKKLLLGNKTENIGDSIESMNKSINELGIFRKELESYLTLVEKRLRKSTQAIHTVRFNPFKGTGNGGNQSFATAFINEDGDGVVVSSLYSREHVSIFSKPIKKGNSEYELTEEERKAIDEAVKIVKVN